ncbi:hypothetical protein PZA11_006759 [Diplocarpon coronariae]
MPSSISCLLPPLYPSLPCLMLPPCLYLYALPYPSPHIYPFPHIHLYARPYPPPSSYPTFLPGPTGYPEIFDAHQPSCEHPQPTGGKPAATACSRRSCRSETHRLLGSV